MSDRKHWIRRLLLETSLMALCFGCVSGCGPEPVKPLGSTADAEETLAVVLDSWIAGRTPTELQEDEPAVHVADEDWQAGASLKDYKFSAAAVQFGGTWRVPAMLTLTTEGQSEVQKKAAYDVTLSPAITVLRVDENID